MKKKELKALLYASCDRISALEAKLQDAATPINISDVNSKVAAIFARLASLENVAMQTSAANIADIRAIAEDCRSKLQEILSLDQGNPTG